MRDYILAHDYLTQRGGAERVALEMAKGLNCRTIYTSTYRPDSTFSSFEKFSIATSFIDSIPVLRADPRLAFPMLPFAWTTHRPVAADAVFCSSSGWSHGLSVERGVPKVVYCHNPARWLYQPDDYLMDRGAAVALAVHALSKSLKRWDKYWARTATCYIANSSSVATRIKNAYGIDARVIYPPVSVEVDGIAERPLGCPDNFFLTVGRARGYKGTSVLVDAFRELKNHNLVIVGGTTASQLSENVFAAGSVTDSQLRWLYANAEALISVSREDFGLTPIEANAFGTPALLLRAGGFLDSTLEGVSGGFIESATPEAVASAVQSFPRQWDKVAIKAHAAAFSPEKFISALKAAATT